MAPTPVRHPLRDVDDTARRRSIAAHPSGRPHAHAHPQARVAVTREGDDPRSPLRVVPDPADDGRPPASRDEHGSMTTEYGLIVVVGATIASLVLKWASGGAIFELLGSIMDAAKGLVGF